jgi:hypothetical protein
MVMDDAEAEAEGSKTKGTTAAKLREFVTLGDPENISDPLSSRCCFCLFLIMLSV